jgi:hypothetical protein
MRRVILFYLFVLVSKIVKTIHFSTFAFQVIKLSFVKPHLRQAPEEFSLNRNAMKEAFRNEPVKLDGYALEMLVYDYLMISKWL